MTKEDTMNGIASYLTSVEGGEVLADALFADTPRDFVDRVAENPIVEVLRRQVADLTAAHMVLQRARQLAERSSALDENQSLTEHSLAIDVYVLGASHESAICEFVDDIALNGTGLAKFAAMQIWEASHAKFGTTTDYYKAECEPGTSVQ